MCGFIIRNTSHRAWHRVTVDKQIVERGIGVAHNGSIGFVYPGYVDGKMGFYNITMDLNGIIKHRMFYPMNKIHQIWVGSKDFKIFP